MGGRATSARRGNWCSVVISPVLCGAQYKSSPPKFFLA